MRFAPPFVAAVLLAGGPGCTDPPADELLVDASTQSTRYERDGTMTMAAGALDDLELDGGMVIVPTDRAIFALDADALADLLAGGLIELVASSALSTDYGSSMEDWPDELDNGSGPARAVTRTDGTWAVDGHPVVDVWRRDEVTVVVVDGVLER